ncbi:MAG: hypothetical protein ABSB40_07155 [Nitrososphaeria archaeon]|jgi:hypothetical protein
MSKKREEIRKWLSGVVEKFREKGAVSPDKAMNMEELGSSAGFQRGDEEASWAFRHFC